MDKKRDYGLILSLGILIAAGSYWFVKELPTDRLEYYMDLLGERLVELVPRDAEKEMVSAKYAELKSRVKEKEVDPANLEKMAAAIINLSNANDTLSLEEAESLIEISVKRTSIAHDPAAEKVTVIPENEKWRNLHDRLNTIHELDKKFKEGPVIAGKLPEKNYRVDGKLNIIIDSKERKRLEKETFIRKLEEEKQVVWMNDMVKSLEKDLKKLQAELADHNKSDWQDQDIIKLEILTQPFIEKGIMIIDSLDIVAEINWDSIGQIMEEEVSHELRELDYRRSSPSAGEN